MASAMARSSTLMVFLLTVGVVSGISFTEDPNPSMASTTELPFDAPEYKQYIDHLSCPKITIYHGGIKIPENATESIYRTTAEGIKEGNLHLFGWTDYNWFQILLNYGGPPGLFLPKGHKSNLTKALDPCSRPLEPATPTKKASASFGFSFLFENVYRQEQAVVQFPGTIREFVDVVGQIIWPPPDSEPGQHFHISYRKDDTGLYVNLESRQCLFDPDNKIVCRTLPSIDSDRIYTVPSMQKGDRYGGYQGPSYGTGSTSYSGGQRGAGLLASLVGGG